MPAAGAGLGGLAAKGIQRGPLFARELRLGPAGCSGRLGCSCLHEGPVWSRPLGHLAAAPWLLPLLPLLIEHRLALLGGCRWLYIPVIVSVTVIIGSCQRVGRCQRCCCALVQQARPPCGRIT